MNVLCVDRDILQLSQIKRQIRKIVPNARISTCRNPRQAVALAEAEGCDVLITGIDMGTNRTEGIRVAEKIKEINPRVNIIFVTVCGVGEHAEEILPLRISGYVRRPYKPEAIAREFDNLRYAAI